MVELILGYAFKFGVLGFGFHLVNKVFSKKTKEIHFSIDQNGVEFDSSFFK